MPRGPDEKARESLFSALVWVGRETIARRKELPQCPKPTPTTSPASSPGSRSSVTTASGSVGLGSEGEAFPEACRREIGRGGGRDGRALALAFGVLPDLNRGHHPGVRYKESFSFVVPC